MMHLLALLIWFQVPTPPSQPAWSCSPENLSEYPGFFTGVQVTRDNHVYLLAGQDCRIFHLSPGGKEIGKFGRKGEGPGEFGFGSSLSLSLSGDSLIVQDGLRKKLVVFDLNGKVKKDIDLPGYGQFQNTYFLSGTRAVTIQKENPFQNPGQGAKIVLADFKSNQETLILKNDVSHHADPFVVGHGAGTLFFPWLPRSIFCLSLESGIGYAGSTKEVNFVAFDIHNGTILGTIKDKSISPVPLTDKEVEMAGSRITADGKTFTAKSFDQPDFKATVGSILADRMGRLWVSPSTSLHSPTNTYIVYGTDGSMEGLFKCPSSQWVIFADEKNMWFREYDEDQDLLFIKCGPYSLSTQ